FMYLSVMIDFFNREVLAYHVSDKPDAKLVLDTLKKLPATLDDCIIHSDKGTQYVNNVLQQTMKEKKIQHSFSEKSSPTQNAVIESFFATLKSELFYCENPEDLNPKMIKKKIDSFIQYYNQKRELKYLGYLSPLQFKKQYEQKNRI
ncbi:DDE-type integrase/transposase/recombinase, partial ['Cynodon dactylon' phytoplasma]